MRQPAAKKGDQVTGLDIHTTIYPPPLSPIPVPYPFKGEVNGNLSRDVKVMGEFAATAGSTAENKPKHISLGIGFTAPPSDTATIKTGSATVKINGKAAARNGDAAETCNEIPPGVPLGKVVASGTVLIG